MTASPVICFGQQPCGFFPRRFLVAKIWTARRLRQTLGGEIVFFYHDSDHDPRETKTVLRNLRTDVGMAFNFEFSSKVQKKYSPLYLKAVESAWQKKTAEEITEFVPPRLRDAFSKNSARDVSAFCLEMYRELGLLEGIRVARSSDPALRLAACDIPKYFVDVPYEGETVRARCFDGTLSLHKGGDAYITLPKTDYTKAQISPARDTRLLWMQSVVKCTHYVCGAGEQAYLNKEETPEITFINRDAIDRAEEAYAEYPV